MEMAETDVEFVERASRTPCGKWPLIDHDRLFTLARRGAAVQAALPAGPISQAQYNEALLTVSRFTEALRLIRDLNKSAEGWTYSQEIEDEIAEILPPPPEKDTQS